MTFLANAVFWAVVGVAAAEAYLNYRWMKLFQRQGADYKHLFDDQHAIISDMLTREGFVFQTKSGRVLTNADIEALADEAERGYDVSHLVKREDPEGGDDA